MVYLTGTITMSSFLPSGCIVVGAVHFRRNFLWSGGEKIEIVSAEYAKKWAEENLTAEEYEAEFGEARELDTVAITVYLPADIVSKLDEIKAKTGMARTAIVEKLVRDGLKNQ